ncbi:hypothetical protein LO763_19370 [Glycomyces sp. A-F 0318]|uniref:hypothetical protein n=1 Tax=Glycomyces amatae TaxID=2881355 RepID=UPI001E525FD3|nr:hypothetical protein [Glycomyces amatae]MCD0445772.1 hypothetical protein [Glycomyces amatae]
MLDVPVTGGVTSEWTRSASARSPKADKVEERLPLFRQRLGLDPIGLDRSPGLAAEAGRRRLAERLREPR